MAGITPVSSPQKPLESPVQPWLILPPSSKPCAATVTGRPRIRPAVAIHRMAASSDEEAQRAAFSAQRGCCYNSGFRPAPDTALADLAKVAELADAPA